MELVIATDIEAAQDHDRAVVVDTALEAHGLARMFTGPGHAMLTTKVGLRGRCFHRSVVSATKYGSDIATPPLFVAADTGRALALVLRLRTSEAPVAKQTGHGQDGHHGRAGHQGLVIMRNHEQDHEVAEELHAEVDLALASPQKLTLDQPPIIVVVASGTQLVATSACGAQHHVLQGTHRFKIVLPGEIGSVVTRHHHESSCRVQTR